MKRKKNFSRLTPLNIQQCNRLSQVIDRNQMHFSWWVSLFDLVVTIATFLLAAKETFLALRRRLCRGGGESPLNSHSILSSSSATRSVNEACVRLLVSVGHRGVSSAPLGDPPECCAALRVSSFILLVVLELYCAAAVFHFAVMLVVDRPGLPGWFALGAADRVSFSLITAMLHLFMTTLIGYFCTAGGRVSASLSADSASLEATWARTAFHASLAASVLVFTAQLANITASFAFDSDSHKSDRIIGACVASVTVLTSCCFFMVGLWLRRLWNRCAQLLEDDGCVDLRRGIFRMTVLCFIQCVATLINGMVFLVLYGSGLWSDVELILLLSALIWAFESPITLAIGHWLCSRRK
jgi:hypothetical protein